MMKYVVCWRSVGIVKIGLQVDYCVICVLLYLLADDNCFHLHATVESKKQVSSLLWMLLEFGAVGLTFKATSLLQAIFFCFSSRFYSQLLPRVVFYIEQNVQQ
jgi:hypothetical protein